MDELLPIGRFSRLCWLSIKALRIYDETGLLRPAYVDPDSGYRYYRPDQAATARVIATLRSLDMPLASIREVLAEPDPDRVRDLLDAYRVVLERRIDRHRHMLNRVETFIRKGAVMAYQITTRDTAPADVLGTTYPTTPDSLSETSAVAYHRLYEAIAAAGGRPDGPPRMVYLDMADDAWTIEACVPVAGVSEAPDGFSLRRAPGGLAALTRHVGPYEELGLAYREVEAWIEAQGLTSNGAPYDVYLNDPSQVSDPAKLETEIVWPVRRG
ncbi:MerR family transcriptional regulator [Jiangella aurantiaca]|uniref:MerR family transcriptional regulator n=1 Tax=Jiangella aurantiaca TaxID=2530373 RepID=A0A4V2YSV3_9ACTN|nr:MerR family transcriptional regulator [Jiangella aurantiaca]TDD71367.1 MerR family transcriptional regulator [Jiangella aurantiaca]